MADHPGPLEGEILAARDMLSLPDGEQLELIRDQLPNRDASTAVEIARRSGRGRPPGARNKQNADFRRFVLSQHSHPGIALARTYDRPVELLAAELQCSLAEAAALQMRAAAELLPYIESKRPVAVELSERHDVVLVMGGAPGVGGQVLDAIADQVNRAEEPIEWETAEFVEIEGAPSASDE